MDDKVLDSKPLSKMTNEELWQLFPIIITDPNPAWKAWYEQENESLKAALPSHGINGIHHIGSTAVGTIKAKPTVDILVVTTSECNWEVICGILVDLGWRVMCNEGSRISFNKGYTEHGFADRVFHLHLRRTGDTDELYFRDYLIAHPETAKEYEALKLALSVKYRTNRDAYTNSKTDFVRKYTELAKKEQARKDII